MATIIHVEDEIQEMDDIVKTEVGAEQSNSIDDTTEQVIVGGGKVSGQAEELSQADAAVQEVQLSAAPANGDLTPEMILSMMDR